MTKLHHVLLAAALCVASIADSASAASDQPEGLNRPSSGAKVLPNGMTGSGLGMALLGARVGSDGFLSGGAGAKSVTLLSTGQYEIEFDRVVTNCLYSVSTFYHGYSPAVEPRSGSSTGVYVAQYDSNNNRANVPFDLVVFCNQ